LQSSDPHRAPHSFPTRRSSDLPELMPDEVGLHDVHEGEIRVAVLEIFPEIVRDALLGEHAVQRRAVRRNRVVECEWHFEVMELRSEEHTSELQSRSDLVCRLLL